MDSNKIKEGAFFIKQRKIDTFNTVLGMRSKAQCPDILVIPNNKPREVFLNMLLNVNKPFNIRSEIGKIEACVVPSISRTKISFPKEKMTASGSMAKTSYTTLDKASRMHALTDRSKNYTEIGFKRETPQLNTQSIFRQSPRPSLQVNLAGSSAKQVNSVFTVSQYSSIHK